MSALTITIDVPKAQEASFIDAVNWAFGYDATPKTLAQLKPIIAADLRKRLDETMGAHKYYLTTK